MTDPTEVPHGTDPSRELALVLAIEFHKDTDTDDPQTVVTTAQDFLAFLLDGVGATGKHQRPTLAGV